MWERLFELLRSPLGGRVVATVAILVFALLLRRVVLGFVNRSEGLDLTTRVRWVANIRGASLFVVLLGLAFVWGAELRDFVVSLVVLATALVLGLKELLMCVSGAILRAFAKSFDVGDRIEVAGLRGDVIDHGIFSTTLLEIGPNHQRTGRTQVLPNSAFLSAPIANETFSDQYVLHTFQVPVDRSDWEAQEARLLEVAHDVAGEHAEATERHMDAVGSRYGLTRFSAAPKVSLQLEAGQLWLRVRIPAPARLRGPLEQRILRRFLGQEAEAATRAADVSQPP